MQKRFRSVPHLTDGCWSCRPSVPYCRDVQELQGRYLGPHDAGGCQPLGRLHVIVAHGSWREYSGRSTWKKKKTLKTLVCNWCTETFSDSRSIDPESDCIYHFLYWFGTKRNSVWFQINRKMVNAIWTQIIEKCFLILVRSTGIGLYLQFSDWFFTKWNSVSFQIIRKTGKYNLTPVDLTRIRKYLFCVCSFEISIHREFFSWILLN